MTSYTYVNIVKIIVIIATPAYQYKSHTYILYIMALFQYALKYYTYVTNFYAKIKKNYQDINFHKSWYVFSLSFYVCFCQPDVCGNYAESFYTLYN